MSLQESAPAQPAVPPGQSPVTLAPPRQSGDAHRRAKIRAIMAMFPGISYAEAESMLRAMENKQDQDGRKKYEEAMGKLAPPPPPPALPPVQMPVTDSDGDGVGDDGTPMAGMQPMTPAQEEVRLRQLEREREQVARAQATRPKPFGGSRTPGSAQPIQPPSQGTPYGFS